MSIMRDGPYLAMAVLCEKVLHEKDGVLSAIRIIDKIVQTVTGPQAPETFPATTFNLFALISLKSGVNGGKYNLKLIPNTPSGEKKMEVSAPVLLQGNGRGANIIINLNLQVKEVGLYWIDVVLEEQLITRIPLHIEYQKMQMGTDTTQH